MQFASETKVNKDPKLITDLSGLHGKIGLFGGSFDPPHADHEALAREVCSRHGLDYFVYLPTPNNPLKGKPLFSESERLEMLSKITSKIKNHYLCDFELKTFSPSKRTYTVETLKDLNKTRAADARIFFILGADCLHELHLWRDYHELFKLAEIVPVERGSAKAETIKSLASASNLTPDEIQTLERNWVSFQSVSETGKPISSTEVRRAISSGTVPSSLLTPEIADYIKEKFINAKRD